MSLTGLLSIFRFELSVDRPILLLTALLNLLEDHGRSARVQLEGGLRVQEDSGVEREVN